MEVKVLSKYKDFKKEDLELFKIIVVLFVYWDNLYLVLKIFILWILLFFFIVLFSILVYKINKYGDSG